MKKVIYKDNAIFKIKCWTNRIDPKILDLTIVNGYLSSYRISMDKVHDGV